MKYYEFAKGLGYYALIGVENVDNAKCLYNESICELEPEEQTEPLEINEQDALNKLLHDCKDNKEKKHEFRYFQYKNQGIEPFLLLVDGDLY